MKTCIHCGKDNTNYATVCVQCGNVIGDDGRLQEHLRNNAKIAEDMKKAQKIEFIFPRITKRMIKKFLLIMIPLTIIAGIINASAEDTEYDPEISGEYETPIDTTNETVMSVEYVLPESNSRYLSESELEGLSAEQLRIARNEIYARHGRLFNDAGLQAYFNSKSWYVGSISPDAFTESMLNEYEVANRDLIVSYEATRGY